jgi:hypothetical protein
MTTCFDQCGHHQVFKFLAKILLSSVFAYVVKYTNPLNAHRCTSLCVVVFCCVVLRVFFSKNINESV